MKTGDIYHRAHGGHGGKTWDIYHEPHEITRKNKNRWQWMFAFHANIRCQYLLSCLFVPFVVKKCISLRLANSLVSPANAGCLCGENWLLSVALWLRTVSRDCGNEKLKVGKPGRQNILQEGCPK